MRSDVSDRDLWDFLHGVCPDTPAPEIPGDEEDHNKAAESESEITDGSYSVISSEESMPPSDPKLFFDEVYDVWKGWSFLGLKRAMESSQVAVIRQGGVWKVKYLLTLELRSVTNLSM